MMNEYMPAAQYFFCNSKKSLTNKNYMLILI